MKRRDDDTQIELLLEKLRWLRLPGMVNALRSLLDQASKQNLAVTDVLHRLCDEEKQSRSAAAVARRIKDAHFPQINTVDAFDFDFSPAARRSAAATSHCMT